MKFIMLKIIPIFILFILTSCLQVKDESKNSSSSQQITTELSEEEKLDLLFMWEEEKMARDVYQELYNKYGAETFKNIAESEQKHMDSVKGLIDQLDLTLPSDEVNSGTYGSLEISNLYNELITQGNVSLTDAYQVGVRIEELDIDDLKLRIDQSVDPAIINTFEKLLDASYNHLEAFQSKL